MSVSKREMFAMVKRSKSTAGPTVTLELLHDGQTRNYELAVFEEHYAKAQKGGKRRKSVGPSVLDMKEIVALRYLGKASHKEVKEISIWLLTEELKDSTSIRRLRGKTVTVVIASKAANEDLIKVSRHYELDDGRKGQCNFFGRTQFAPAGKWVGLSLWEGEGKNDGSVYGKYYFRCKEGKGIFVRPNKIRKEIVFESSGMKSKSLISTEDFDDLKQNYISESRRSLAQLKRSLSQERRDKVKQDDWKPYVSDVAPDHSDMFGKKTLYTRAQLRKHYGEKADKKMTITEFQAWIKDQPGWEAAKFEITDTGQSKGLMYTQKVLHLRDGESAARKLGPQDIGLAKDFEKAKYDLNTEDVRYDLTYLISKLRKNVGKKAERKPGPQEIGLAEDFEAPSYQLNLEDVRYDLTYTMKKLHANDGKKAARKLGPQEIGLAKDFDEAKYELNLEDTRYDISYTVKDLHKNDGKRAEHRPTLEQIGNNKGYKSYDGPVTGFYEGGIQENPTNFYYSMNRLHKNDGEKAEKKKTVQEMGSNADYKAYNGPVTGHSEGDFLAERDQNYRGKSYTAPVPLQKNSCLSLDDNSDSNSSE